METRRAMMTSRRGSISSRLIDGLGETHLARDRKEVFCAIVGKDVWREVGANRNIRGRNECPKGGIRGRVGECARKSDVASSCAPAAAAIRRRKSSRFRGNPRLQLALPAARSRPPVLEPVEDIGVPNRPESLEKLPYPHGVVLRGVDHAAVEDGLEYQNLLRLGRPPGPHALGGGEDHVTGGAVGAALGLSCLVFHGGRRQGRRRDQLGPTLTGWTRRRGGMNGVEMNSGVWFL